MRKVVFSILLMICAMSSKAQSLAAPDGEGSGIAVFNGNIKDVPDGPVVNFWYPENGDYIGEAVAKIDKGKFSFKKMINQNAKYLITLGDGKEELIVRTLPGTTMITGDTPNCSHWRVENDNPLVVEENAFKDRRKAIREEYEKEEKRREQMGQQYTKDVYAEERFYVNSMCEFMKDKSYSRFYLDELRTLARMVITKDDDSRLADCKKKVSELCVKLPLDRLGEFQDLYTNKELNTGDNMVDFKLYDHDGREHHLAEFNGNGKYKLLEFCCKEDKKTMEERPKYVLDKLYEKFSNNLDIVTVNCDSKDAWMSGKLPRDQWNEWNDHKRSIAVMMKYSTVMRFVFISPNGKILGFGNYYDLRSKSKQYFAFVN